MRIVALSLFVAVVAGCGHTGSLHDGFDSPTGGAAEGPTTGAVTGTILGAGGPLGARDNAWAGTVRARNLDDQRIWVARTDAHGRFSMRLPPGNYSLGGMTPSYLEDAPWACGGFAGDDVTVSAGKETSYDVICNRR
jgi:hypothetical protein